MKTKLVTIFILLFFLNFTVNAKMCLSEDSIDIKWTAFKTASKVGVKGSFKNINFKLANKEAKELKDILVGSTIKLKNEDVFSKNKARDLKLTKFFFNKLRGEIRAIIEKVEIKNEKEGIVFVKITMNNKTQTVPMKYSYKDNKFKAKGYLDIFDFSGNNALESINKACYNLHEGKTWSDVKISFTLNINCK